MLSITDNKALNLLIIVTLHSLSEICNIWVISNSRAFDYFFFFAVFICVHVSVYVLMSSCFWLGVLWFCKTCVGKTKVNYIYTRKWACLFSVRIIVYVNLRG